MTIKETLLDGVECPNCRKNDRIDVVAQQWVRVTHDGTDADLAHDHKQEWDDRSPAHCAACGYYGTVGQFRAAAN